MTDAGVADKVRRAVEQSIEVIRRRVDALGTTEPLIERQGNDRILVEVAGPAKSRDKLKQILGTTDKLDVSGRWPTPAPIRPMSKCSTRPNQPGVKIPVEKSA